MPSLCSSGWGRGRSPIPTCRASSSWAWWLWPWAWGSACPVGGADTPVLISLLNSLTGLAVAADGFALQNLVLVVAGTLVGTSGALLTKMMSDAMGRSLSNIVLGGLTTAGSTEVVGGPAADRSVRTADATDIGALLAYSRRVLIVPGYGLAVAQAQRTVVELAKALEARGVEVAYAIHPVAGRMPGHMNVLLAEADVPYESLDDLEDANAKFPAADVALVVGANDVVNPAARDDPSQPALRDAHPQRRPGHPRGVHEAQHATRVLRC